MKTVLWAGNNPERAAAVAPKFDAREIRLVYAGNGMDALESVESLRPDVLVIEERFSHRDWLLNLVRSEPEFSTLRLLMFPEKARFRPSWTYGLNAPPPLIPVPVTLSGEAVLSQEYVEQFQPVEEPGGNPDQKAAAEALMEFYLTLIRALL